MADKRAKDTTTKNAKARGEAAPPAADSNEEQAEGTPAANPAAHEEQQSALDPKPA